MSRKFDIIVFGATGFTGSKVCMEIERNPPKKDLKWGIASRSIQKLEQLHLSSNPKLFKIDIDDQEDLVKICKQARLIINCIGPFRFYGEPIIQACISAKTDYLDICGETEFIEKMYYNYNERAAESGISVICAAASDSLPADLGCLVVKQEFAKLNSQCSTVEMFVNLKSKKGYCINHTTWDSALLSFQSVGELRKLRNKHSVEKDAKTLQIQKYPFWQPRLNCWAVLAPVADASVVKLSQKISKLHKTQKFKNLYVPLGLESVEFAGYFALNKFVHLLFIFYLGILILLSRITYLRALMMKYPDIWTLGVFSKRGPSEEQMEASGFTCTFFGKSRDCQLVLEIKGPEFGYKAASICVVAGSHLMLNEHRKKVPFGVLTPAAAFSNLTSILVDKLEKRGFSFKTEIQ